MVTIASADDFNKAIEGVRSKGLETALIKVARNGDSTFIGLPITE
jgi:serine protease Do